MTYSSLQQPADALFHQKETAPRVTTGVLLVNLGTPDAPTTPSVRTYLAEFLSEPRGIEIPPLAWKLILHGIILRVRPKKSAALYKSIWTDEGSPLLAISQRQLAAIQQALGSDVSVKLGMRYGNPSIASALREFREAGISSHRCVAAVSAICRAHHRLCIRRHRARVDDLALGTGVGFYQRLCR